ncbi:RNA-processing protein [Candidatus Bathyarchaeota archaeon]|nr:RNA-processing protein [Candidatus Bathyarchaeota archaeon]NIV44506.1 RNA-processing protein [Candidatus Bathyarchaeota archaeon]
MSKASTFIRIPRDRVGALIGPDGRVKANIEKKLNVKLEIDSPTGEITITLDQNAQDPSLLFRAKEVITAIGRGFSPQRAIPLLQDTDTVLEVIDLRQTVGKSPADIQRLKGRIIGKGGKTRRIIEELTDAEISVYGHTVSIIGNFNQTNVAAEAILMLIKGSQHSTVYRFLQKKRQELKRKKLELWETRQEETEK